MNSVNLIGNAVADPELRTFQKDGKENTVAKFAIAVYRSKEHTDFFDVDAFGWAAEAAEKFVSKGQKIALSGSIKQEEWSDKDGNPRKGYRVKADRIYPCGGAIKESSTNADTTTANVTDDELITF